MKKLKELNLSVGTTPDVFPKKNNADTSFSRSMQRTFTTDYFDYLEDEESEDDDMILNKRKAKNGKYALLETLENIVEKQASTEKYDKNKHLRGDQDKLPDGLQKGIIKKADPNDPDLDEESFEEIDLAEFSSAGAVAGYSVQQPGPNPNKPNTKKAQTAHHKLFEKQKAMNEQREMINRLQAYHQKTTNKLK